MSADKNGIEVMVKGLRKSYGDLEVLKGADLQVHSHEVVTLIGPSGSGKSTLLRCLNLLECPDEGEIVWRGEPVRYETMSAKEMARHRTHMGMVFQHFQLFPHRRVIENVIEGPVHVLGRPVQEARERGLALLEQVGIADKADCWPSQLSGGQKQRVAIARSLAMNPQVLLLDEVTSALDVEMITGINELLANLAAGGMTMVVVTHDLAFARSVSSRMFFLDEGNVVEHGTPDDLLERPQNERTREFLANCRFVPA